MNDIDEYGNLVQKSNPTDAIPEENNKKDLEEEGLEIGAEKYGNLTEEEVLVINEGTSSGEVASDPAANVPVEPNITELNTNDPSVASPDLGDALSAQAQPVTPTEVIELIKEDEVSPSAENAKIAEAALAAAPLSETVADPNTKSESSDKPTTKKVGFWGRLFKK